MASLQELFQLGEMNESAYECTRQSRWKETTQRYLANLLVNNIELQGEVLEGRYKVSKTIDFTINERGHIRHIEAPIVRDRIVQKVLTKNVLSPVLTKSLIYDNYASLKHRGTAFARKRFESMLRRYYAKNGTDGYIMLIDIKKYFDNIDHDVLKELIRPLFAGQSQDTRDLIDYIIDTSSHSNKGLNLGSEAPQIFAIYYLHKVDSYIKIVRGVRYYGRYMDDMFMIGKSKEELKALLEDIKSILATLRLEINEKKTSIVKLSHGFTYLQVKYNITPFGKIIKRPSHNKIAREKRRLKAFKRMHDAGRMSLEDIQNCYQSWRGSFIADHNTYKTTLGSMDALYKRLFPDTVEKRKLSRAELINEADKDMKELKHILNH